MTQQKMMEPDAGLSWHEQERREIARSQGLQVNPYRGGIKARAWADGYLYGKSGQPRRMNPHPRQHMVPVDDDGKEFKDKRSNAEKMAFEGWDEGWCAGAGVAYQGGSDED